MSNKTGNSFILYLMRVLGKIKVVIVIFVVEQKFGIWNIKYSVRIPVDASSYVTMCPVFRSLIILGLGPSAQFRVPKMENDCANIFL